MSNNDDYKPLNPNSKVIEGRLQNLLYFVSKVYSEAVPSFMETIKEEDRVNGILKCDFAKTKDVSCISNSMWNGGWSLMRPVGKFGPDDIIVMVGMSAREERDNIPRRLFVFRVGDAETKTITTKVGERDATFFSMDNIDAWEKFSCTTAGVNLALRSLVSGSVDPDLAGSPFKSYLTSIIDGTLPKPDIHVSNGDTDAQDWDADINF